MLLGHRCLEDAVIVLGQVSGVWRCRGGLCASRGVQEVAPNTPTPSLGGAEFGCTRDMSSAEHPCVQWDGDSGGVWRGDRPVMGS